ncbi:hypothetical protein D8X55_01100 [Malacoplasma penetrans]|uniref:hypothetical protein n=1 Tax=Malacoplasma penetrans TaxID=28227 RepID=UPI0005D130BF|nr:hypothetical protein [Malacoplasma penetrans]RXY97059.1 hypothetical protein D8X55_01100 [Malacoplasma penetrans]
MKLNKYVISEHNLNSASLFHLRSFFLKEAFLKFKIKENLLIYNLNIQLDLLFDLLVVFFYPFKEMDFKFAISTDTQTFN